MTTRQPPQIYGLMQWTHTVIIFSPIWSLHLTEVALIDLFKPALPANILNSGMISSTESPSLKDLIVI